jgi:hypothetical protein
MKTLIQIIAVTATVNLVNAAGVLAQASTTQPVSSSGVTQAASDATGGSYATFKADMGKLKTWAGPSQSGAGSVLVVPAAEVAIEDLRAATEDMAVMARIFQSALKQADLSTARFIGDTYGVYGGAFFLGRGEQQMQSIYLQGYGALFTMQVNFPLSPGPQKEEAPQEKAQTDVDPVWQQTRQDIFEPERPDRRRSDAEETVKYSAERVEDLKTTLITALKHAANIRNMASEEAVVVRVTDQPVRSSIESVLALPGTNQITVAETNGRKVVYNGGLPADVEKTATPTVLLVRAKRADIDSFAKGDLNLDQFRQKVQILSYPQLGAGTGVGVMTSITTGYGSR